ncbi:hypothetical protein [Gimesia maris]|uniref:Uncharacterized protein n=1 Tax=Gimesia maris TaxID=122 RepID=A0ABX5YRF7_9PLAN|nr:hypothetical protein [Gimesia maris]EDL59249.1 hypothetical protein PM8797T_23419 [Gimesia maris DSM 8797]QEG18213.1 hypothetical protein GmarT_40990 [Gimesia maris]QGQ28786.1 hypothetical protein F1729_09095 [Gimesia maris]
MSFWSLVGTLITGAIIAGIVVTVLSIDSIVDWFREQLGHRQVSDRLAVTILQNLEHGNYQVVQGVFNTSTQEYESQRTVNSSEVDQQFLSAHNEDGLAVWNV